MPPVNNGKVSMNLREKFWPRSGACVSNKTTASLTSTVCCTSPSSRRKSTICRKATRISMLLWVAFLNPVFSTVREYGPTGKLGNTNSPASVVTVLNSCLVGS